MKLERLSYEDFLRAKMAVAVETGIEVSPENISSVLKPHQRDIVRWALRKGRAAVFAAFGLGKTLIQLEIARLLVGHLGGRFLIVCPLGVRQEFARDAGKIGVEVRFARRLEECGETGIYLTNYETIRDGKMDPREFLGVSLDEAAILRSFGSKTFSEFLFGGRLTAVKYRFVATATPAPNDFMELLAYSAFLDVMDIGQARTRFFQRNSEKAKQLTLHPHKEREFWLWCSSWAIFLQRPSDLGYSDEGYDLPKLAIYWHELPSDHRSAGVETSGQGRLLADTTISVSTAAAEKRNSLAGRIAKMQELRALDPGAHRLIWHDLEAEREAIERAIPGAVSVYGSQDLEEREQAIIDFSDGRIAELAAKPVIAGSGCNFQRYCSWAIFLGIGFKFNDLIQAIHRIHRFLQTRPVRIDLIYTEAERQVRRILEKKWAQDEKLRAYMSEIIRRYGLAANALHAELQRSIGVERREAKGRRFRAVLNDSVIETREMASDSIDLILTSIPFSTQYEYTPSYNDFGHTESNEHFFTQMDYLSPELFRVLKPGRVCAVHVKDRVVPGAMTDLGFQTVYRFSDHVCDHFESHGFAFLGRKTIVTDVVRENNQTYRLGWTEQCKDGSRMGAGMPEYLLLFRKPPTDRSNGYADEPVVKDKAAYSRARWQIDAHGFERSNGNRLLTPEDLKGLHRDQIYKLYRRHSLTQVYDYGEHVALGEALDLEGLLPVDFMLLPPQSWHPDIWSDITRMRTLNSSQAQAGKMKHICPLQFDVADRVIAQFSQKGEIVYDPFAGLFTVPLRAVKLERIGWGCELNGGNWADGVVYLRGAEEEVAAPTLFEVLEVDT